MEEQGLSPAWKERIPTSLNNMVTFLVRAQARAAIYNRPTQEIASYTHLLPGLLQRRLPEKFWDIWVSKSLRYERLAVQ